MLAASAPGRAGALAARRGVRAPAAGRAARRADGPELVHEPPPALPLPDERPARLRPRPRRGVRNPEAAARAHARPLGDDVRLAERGHGAPLLLTERAQARPRRPLRCRDAAVRGAHGAAAARARGNDAGRRALLAAPASGSSCGAPGATARRSRTPLAMLRRAGWPAYSESQLDAAVRRIRQAVGSGPQVRVGYAQRGHAARAVLRARCVRAAPAVGAAGRMVTAATRSRSRPGRELP